VEQEAAAVNDESIQSALERYGVQIPQSQQELLVRYCQSLWAWNRKINLTRHTDYDQFVRRDLLDTIYLIKHIPEGYEILDVGTGGGVPGVLMAILRPDLKVSLCDGVGKKARAVQDIVRDLDLPIAVYAQRVQQVLEDLRFHILVTRASGSISQLMVWLTDYWAHFDQLIAIKGPRWTEERGEARHRNLLSGVDLRCLETYPMPGTESQSTILSFTVKASRGTKTP
jgi:16S rRNA (guanine527-N7)-methyltransferase